MPFVPDAQPAVTAKPRRFVPDAEQKKPTSNSAKPSVVDFAVNSPGLFGLSPRQWGGAAELGANVLSGMVAQPLSGLAGIAGTMIPGKQGQGAEWAGSVSNALTYQPRGEIGKQAASQLTYPFEKFAQFADWSGQQAADAAHSPLLGAGVNTTIQALPALFLRRGKVSAPQAEAAARSYVSRSVGTDWGALPQQVQNQLVRVAKEGGNLDAIQPQAIARQATLEKLPVPIKDATRGQLTRDPAQLRNEGNVSATSSGAPLREKYLAQNETLLKNLDVLKGRTRGIADSAEQVGLSVQDAALRKKLELKKQQVSKLYAKAEATGELEAPVSPKGIIDTIEASPDKTHFKWVNQWLRDMDVRKTETTDGITVEALHNVSLREIEDLRQAAVARAMNGGTEGVYAGKVIKAIDEATEGAGGKAYQAARRARKEQALEFEDQRSVARLVDDASRTDRATALEDTWKKTVLGGSIQDLRNVKRSLLTGGDTTTRAAGKQAWRDMRAATIEHIRKEATKSVATDARGNPNITPASMERAIKSIGPDKLNEIFGAGTAQKIHTLMEATRILKTVPAAAPVGSSTMQNILTFLDHIPGGGVATGAVNVAQKIKEVGTAGRTVRESGVNPITQQIPRKSIVRTAGPLAVTTQEQRR